MVPGGCLDQKPEQGPSIVAANQDESDNSDSKVTVGEEISKHVFVQDKTT